MPLHAHSVPVADRVMACICDLVYSVVLQQTTAPSLLGRHSVCAVSERSCSLLSYWGAPLQTAAARMLC